ncbi:MAG: cupin [Calditrichae bacterium]|nr:cupin [Calditrichota bacterium]MCB9057886.1 cupin [Calditrichia bacterium]
MHIKKPTIIKSAGNKPKKIEEFIGMVNSKTSEISIARMTSPAGWLEPAQKPDFDEYTFVLKGCVVVKTHDQEYSVNADEVFFAEKGKEVRYSTPQGAEYIAICIPAFSPDTVHRRE